MEGPFRNLDSTEVKIEPHAHDEYLEDYCFDYIKEEPFENEDAVSYIEIETNSGECIKEEAVEGINENSSVPFDAITENGSISTMFKVSGYT